MGKMRYRWRIGAIALVVLLVLASCAPGLNDLAGSPAADGEVAGFWDGLWHGIITPATFIISVLGGKVHIYEVHNTGNWYNFGYLLGLCFSLGGAGGGGAAASRRRRRET